MFSKKQIKIVFSIVILFISVAGIILSDNSSKFSKPFEKSQSALDSQLEPELEKEIQGVSISIIPSEEPEYAEDFDEENLASDQGSVDIPVGYKVIKVVDGDTIDVLIDNKTERLRLIGIDTPETVDPRKKVQCFGKEASNKSKEMLLGNFVVLESDATQGERDKYKRLLRYVFLPDGTNFNLFMIAEGYAHEYTYDDPYKYQFDFKEAQRLAMENEKGLWSPLTCSGNN